MYKAMHLNLRRRARRRLPKRERAALYVPRLPDSVWSADFMSDALYHGPRFRTFNVIDDFNREVVAIEIDTSLRSARLIRLFERIHAERGLPDMLRVDNGPELLSGALVEWMSAHGVLIDYIEPGKPNQNAYIERFNRTYRTEVLNLYLFLRLDDVREAAYWWMIQSSNQRDHDSLGDSTPASCQQFAEVLFWSVRLTGHVYTSKKVQNMSQKECHVQAKKVQRRVQARSRSELTGNPGVSVSQVARDFGIGAGLLSRWRREIGERQGRKPLPALGVPQDQNIPTSLKRELTRVNKERDFLRDAAAFFARESS